MTEDERKEKKRLRMKAYRSTPEYKEKHRIKAAEWRKNNREKHLEFSRNNYNNNKGKINSERRERYANDIEYKLKRIETERKYKESGRRQEMHRIRYLNNTEEEKRKSLEWKRNNVEHVREYSRNFRAKYWLKHEQENRDNLADSYVVMVIKKQMQYGIKTKDIPKEIIELKRNSIKIKRKRKDYEN
jgi:hypothetical protein